MKPDSYIRMLLVVACLVGAVLSSTLAYGGEPVKIGVLAYRSKAQTLAQWQLLAKVLNQAIPAYDFEIEALTFNELELAVASRQVDFVITNPAHYIRMTRRSGLSAPLATLAAIENGRIITVFGGVIFTQATQANINSLSDIKGKIIAATSVDSMGGYQMQAYELSRVGIHLPQDAKLLATGMPHDNVVNAVLAGHADVGFVRTGLLEAMARDSKFDLKRLKVLNLQNLPGFPVKASTRLYPEWPFAVMPHTDEVLAKKVAVVLFTLEDNAAVTQLMGIHGFIVPADYTPVIDMLKELRAPPFEMAPSFTLKDVWVRYFWEIMAGLLAIGFILLITFRLLLTKRKLASEQLIVLQQQQRLQESESWLQATLDAIPDLLFEIGLDGRYYLSPSQRQDLLVAPSEELVGKLVSEMLPPDAAAIVMDALQEANMNGYSQGKQFELQLPQGAFWFELSVAKKEANLNQIPHFIVLSRDITERKVAEDDQRIASIAFESQEGMMVTDASTIILRVNSAFTDITGYSAEEAIGQTPRLFSSGYHHADFYAAMWESIHTTGAWEGEIRNQRKNVEQYPEYINITAVKDAHGIVTNYVATFTDITLRKAAADEIHHLAFYDSLTRLPNRRLLVDRLNQALASSTRSGNEGALLFLDLDHFKTLNDSLGHDIGDLLLQQVATRLTECVREGDTVARLGGDEYVVMLEDLSDSDLEAANEAEIVGEKIIQSLRQPYLLGSHEYTSTCSIGITIFNDHESSSEELLKQADIAMYQAKTEGRNMLRFFDSKMQDSINARVSMEAELRKALDKSQFQLYYQVQVDSTHKPLGAEALIRWIHPERGLISPFHFIPLAEDTGLILPIGQWVLETACAQLKAWEQHAHMRDLTIAINVSAKQFRQTDFVVQVQAAIDEYAINPMLLKLELTESMLLDNVDGTIATMNALKELGIRFSLDDFGTGYSSLQYLKRLPLYQLKIDQSFVRDIAIDSSDQAIVSTIVAMAHTLNLNEIAEGVETEEQQRLLLEIGCTHYQGYLFGRPLPIEQFEAALLIYGNKQQSE